jgi:hypothetical protein
MAKHSRNPETTTCTDSTSPRVVFATLESVDGERTLKQHGYTEAMRGPSYSDNGFGLGEVAEPEAK